jgi:hypothetical protein
VIFLSKGATVGTSRIGRARKYLKLQNLLAFGSIAAALVTAVPAHASVADARNALEARVLVARSAIQDAAEVDPETTPDGKFAQWFNWGNWNNWNNWPNWSNWGNWFNR